MNVDWDLIKHIMEWFLLPVAGAIAEYSRRHLKSHQRLEKAQMHQLQSLLLDKHERHTKEGHISMHHKEVYHNLHGDYNSLDGNSFIDDISGEVYELPYS